MHLDFRTEPGRLIEIKAIRKHLGRDHLSPFRSTGVQANDGTTKFRLSKLLSTNHRTVDQLKFKSCYVIC